MVQDSGVQHKSGLNSLDHNAYSSGLEDIGLVDEQVEAYSRTIQDFYARLHAAQRCQPGTREVEVMLKGAIYAIGSCYQGNLAWQQHCATSLREIFLPWNDVGVIREDILYLENNPNAALAVQEDGDLRKFWHYYSYFCGIDHHDAEKIMHTLNLITGESMLLQDCLKDEVFKARVVEFFAFLPLILEMIDRRR